MKRERETRILACIISRIRRNFVSVKVTFEKMLNAKSLAVRVSYGVTILYPCRIESVAASYNIRQHYVSTCGSGCSNYNHISWPAVRAYHDNAMYDGVRGGSTGGFLQGVWVDDRSAVKGYSLFLLD